MRVLTFRVRLTQLPLTKRNAMQVALLFRQQVMPLGGKWHLLAIIPKMVGSDQYRPTTTWAAEAGFRYEAAQALEVSIYRTAATRQQTNHVPVVITGPT